MEEESLPPQTNPTKHDAKPKELSKDSLSWDSLGVMREGNDTSKLFTNLRFSDLGLHGHLADVIQADPSRNGFGLTTCTAVQSMTLPLFTAPRQGGLQVLIKSQTGSGKTLTYLLPIFHDLLGLQPPVTREDGCRALIIAPTRELCLQIDEVMHKLSRCCVNIVCGSIVGGEKKKSEKARLRKGVVVLVGTPGRLLDHLRLTESFSLQKLRFIVLDEIDRLLDMGFEQTIMEILRFLRGEQHQQAGLGNLTQRWNQQNAWLAKKCQQPQDLSYLMASATLPPAVRKLAWPIMSTHAKRGVHFVNGDQGDRQLLTSEDDLHACAVYRTSSDDTEASPLTITASVPTGLRQFYMLVSCKWRLPALLSFLHLRRKEKVVVFFSTCDAVDYHALLLRLMRWPQGLDTKGAYEAPDPAEGKHGGKGQKNRPASSNTNASPFIDPLPFEFSGVLGKDTKMYRLHGRLPPDSRKQAFSAFSAARGGSILLCTDVAARGLDLQTVDWILQYDAPCDTMDYLHRIGRTARRGRTGNAMLFLLPTEALYITLLASHGLQLTKASSQSMLLEASKEIPGATKFKNTDEMTAVILQRRAENTIYDYKHLIEAGAQAYRSYVRAYSTRTADAKGIFKVKDLHLGHLSKAFALREKPSELITKEDVIAKIFNGDYMSRDSPLRKELPKKAAADVDKKRKREDKPKTKGKALKSTGQQVEEEDRDGEEDVEGRQEDDEVLSVGDSFMSPVEMTRSDGAKGKRSSAGEISPPSPQKQSREAYIAAVGYSPQKTPGGARKDEEEAVEEEQEGDGLDAEEVEQEGGKGEEDDDDVPAAKKAKVGQSLVMSKAALQRSKLRQRAQLHKSSRRNDLTASGRFRSGGGYFKKRLRNEFAAR